MAKAIFDRHLGMAASEPVNVDSQARQIAQEGLANPSELVFAAVSRFSPVDDSYERHSIPWRLNLTNPDGETSIIGTSKRKGRPSNSLTGGSQPLC